MGPRGLLGGTSGGPSSLPGERLGLQGACREGVLGPRGLPGGASGGPSGLPGERLGLHGACREGVLGPRGLQGGRLEPQRPANSSSKGEKWPILVTVRPPGSLWESSRAPQDLILELLKLTFPYFWDPPATQQRMPVLCSLLALLSPLLSPSWVLGPDARPANFDPGT